MPQIHGWFRFETQAGRSSYPQGFLKFGGCYFLDVLRCTNSHNCLGAKHVVSKLVLCISALPRSIQADSAFGSSETLMEIGTDRPES